VEWGARNTISGTSEFTIPFMRIRNTGAYPITITKILADGYSLSQVWSGSYSPLANISDIYRLAPGEEMEIGRSPFFPPDPGSGNRRFFNFYTTSGGKSASNAYFYNIATSYCTRSPPYGTLVVNNFGFEYTETIDGQTITKREVGVTPLAIKCTDAPYDW